MYLYTESHVTAVFILGILNGVLISFIIQEYRTGYRLTRLLLKMALKPLIKHYKHKKPIKAKIPAAATASTFRKSA